MTNIVARTNDLENNITFEYTVSNADAPKLVEELERENLIVYVINTL